ncbi:hypothetical protein AVEN_74773-1 [Araneus ventricosus]|uniref:Uncharacterized protein n=1 Tax=Araneus ventricosus TaxID=182803 RepID=A0A4Y2NDS5_ARAVE|nr:hypothetical protein AVEN_74773-1 [Araneus ventricosus]
MLLMNGHSWLNNRAGRDHRNLHYGVFGITARELLLLSFEITPPQCRGQCEWCVSGARQFGFAGVLYSSCINQQPSLAQAQNLLSSRNTTDLHSALHGSGNDHWRLSGNVLINGIRLRSLAREVHQINDFLLTLCPLWSQLAAQFLQQSAKLIASSCTCEI